MRVLLVLSALAASTQLTEGLHSLRVHVSTYPACDAAMTKQFKDNLNFADHGCTAASFYSWDGHADPTDAQRAQICQCTIPPFDVPKCYWKKQGKYDVSTAEHFNFVYNCGSISGKPTPTVTEVDASAPVSVPHGDVNSDCTYQQLTEFESALVSASGGCFGSSFDFLYNWGGSANPTKAEKDELCHCGTPSPFAIPSCSVQKGPDRVQLAVHYNWVMSQCSTYSDPVVAKQVAVKSASAPARTSISNPECTNAMTQQFADSLNYASHGCAASSGYQWGGRDDPTDAQRAQICQCNVSPFNVPKCYWKKQGKYDVSTVEHFNFVYNCGSISGKATPKLWEVDAVAPVPVPQPVPHGDVNSDCTYQQLAEFESALVSSSRWCTRSSFDFLYNWGGSANPTKEEKDQLCRCATARTFAIPSCSVQKGPDRVALDVHYNWVMSQCPAYSRSVNPAYSRSVAVKSASAPDTNFLSNAGLVAGIVACGVLNVVLIIGFVLYKRNRTHKDSEQPSDDQATLSSRVDRLTTLVEQQTVMMQEMSAQPTGVQ